MEHLFLRVFRIITILGISLVLVLAIGKDSHGSFTIQDEIKLGREFYEKLKSKNLLLENKRIVRYVDTIGHDILAGNKSVPFTFTFSVVKSSGINAFATPGGYIYVYEGLIKLAENEAQLAGVLAHEIAHVNSRHIAESIEKSQKVSLATLVGILAGVFLGGGGDGTAAITTLSMAMGTSLNLKYTRENEEEADRLGMKYLVDAGYDGRGMLEFLKSMRRYEYYSNSIPSYFLTHPGTGDRIRYLDGLLQTVYTKKGAQSIRGNYDRIKTLVVLSEDNAQSNLNFFQNATKDHPESVDFLFGLATIQSRVGRNAEALQTFSRALEKSPHDEDLLRGLGICYLHMGRTDDAITELNKAYGVNDTNSETIMNLGKAYEAAGNYFIALDLYEKFHTTNPDDTEIYYHLAMMHGKLNNPGESHYNFGIHFKHKHKLKSALFHFNAALKFFPEQSEKNNIIKKEITALGDTRRGMPKSHSTERK